MKMMKIVMKLSCCLVAMATFVNSCSPPIGGFKEPTPAEIVGNSNHVVVGEVTEIITPDPLYGNGRLTTYGATVSVHCTYKNGSLPQNIRIGGAGSIPGMCKATPLEKGKQYVLFLGEKNVEKNLYEQTETAVLKTELNEFLNICGMEVQYPTGSKTGTKRPECPSPTIQGCIPPVDPANTTLSSSADGITLSPNSTEVPVILNGTQTGTSNRKPPPRGGTVSKPNDRTSNSKGGRENAATMVTTTSGLAIMFSVLCYLSV